MATYCISDLHGDYDKFIKFQKNLNDDDIYYVLGDVIDRGPRGIAILLDIMHDKRAVMLIGNHEYMMLQYLQSQSQADYHQWCILNGGAVTLEDYNGRDEKTRQDIVTFIKGCYLTKTVEMADRKFYLAHSSPDMQLRENLMFKDCSDDEVTHVVWERQYTFPGLFTKVPNATVISGHTFVQTYGSNKIAYSGRYLKQSRYIDIDGGCALQDENSSLIVLKLDDLTVEYVK